MTRKVDTLDVVTGAFSYSGAAITSELQAAGHRVRTLTGHPERARTGTGTGVEVRPLNFDDPAELTRSMHGAHTLYNTYCGPRLGGGLADGQPPGSPCPEQDPPSMCGIWPTVIREGR